MKKYLITDRILQSFIFIPYALFGLAGVFGMIFNNDMSGGIIFYMILHFCIGVYQIISGLIGGLYYGDERRKQYLLMNVGYFSIAFLGSLLTEGLHYEINQTLGMIYFFIIPSCIAIWYYVHTTLHREAW